MDVLLLYFEDADERVGETETTPVDQEQYDRDVMWLKANSRNATNEAEIVVRMKRTYEGRRRFISGAANQPTPTIEEMLSTFPRFLDTDGLV